MVSGSIEELPKNTCESLIITCFYLNTNYELNKKWESGIRGIIMFMIIIFMIKSEIKFCVEFSFGYIFL